MELNDRFINEVAKDTQKAVTEFLEIAKPDPGKIFIMGCSSSEVIGGHIGQNSSMDVAKVIFQQAYSIATQHRLWFAAQCCEHLNRAIVIEKEIALTAGFDIVHVIPQIKAGGAFATATYSELKNPVIIEFVKADLGIDIGHTLIGMHLKHVAVPVRLSLNKIGHACIVCANTRPKYIGGNRAAYGT